MAADKLLLSPSSDPPTRLMTMKIVVVAIIDVLNTAPTTMVAIYIYIDKYISKSKYYQGDEDEAVDLAAVPLRPMT